jgi:hypothetical protein
MSERTYWVYIMTNQSGTLYTGVKVTSRATFTSIGTGWFPDLPRDTRSTNSSMRNRFPRFAMQLREKNRSRHGAVHTKWH